MFERPKNPQDKIDSVLKNLYQERIKGINSVLNELQKIENHANKIFFSYISNENRVALQSSQDIFLKKIQTMRDIAKDPYVSIDALEKSFETFLDEFSSYQKSMVSPMIQYLRSLPSDYAWKDELYEAKRINSTYLLCDLIDKREKQTLAQSIAKPEVSYFSLFKQKITHASHKILETISSLRHLK